VTAFTESTVEEAALAWLESLRWQFRTGAKIAPGELFPEHEDYDQIVLDQHLRDALARLNADLPAEAPHDAFRRLTGPEGATLKQRNRAVHRMLVDGVTVQYRRPDGSIAGAQARILDFDDPDKNDWLAVNQFTVIENHHSRRPDLVLSCASASTCLPKVSNARPVAPFKGGRA
jgi:type I restriction enzyme R subunit